MFRNKIVLVTGAGSGLGAQLAISFCSSSAEVIGIGKTLKKLKKTESMIMGRNFHYYSVDVSDYESITKVVSEIIKEHKKIDYLFNNAAVYPKSDFLNETAEEFCKVISTNVCGISNLCKAVLPYMISNNFGRIFNIGSWAHLSPVPNSAAYSCSKAAVHTLTKAISKDVAKLGKNVEIHEWIPGHLNTAMSDFTGIDPSIAAQWAVRIAALRPRSNKNCIFDQNSEWIAPRSFKEKLRSKFIFFRK